MSVFIGTRCDSCGILSSFEPMDIVDNEGWVEDDMEGHTCPDCQERAANLEANTAGSEDLVLFSETLSKTADSILESPEVVKFKAERLEAYEKIKKDTLKAIRKDMKAQGIVQSDIDEVLKQTEQELDDTYNQKFNFKAEA